MQMFPITIKKILSMYKKNLIKNRKPNITLLLHLTQDKWSEFLGIEPTYLFLTRELENSLSNEIHLFNYINCIKIRQKKQIKFVKGNS